ncbi:MAG: C4-dicarboxylic acid transporter DauA [Planctomycetota bacterium]
MPHRYEQKEAPRLRLAHALRESWQEGYGARELRADVVAGIVVGIVALPLAMALAIASGVPPQYGLYTSIVAGAMIPLLGGSRSSVSGPTAAFVVLLAPISHRFGLGGLLLATMMAGAILVAIGVARLGRWIQFVPHPVTTGFTAGIAIVIATLQLTDFLGLSIEHMPEHFPEKVAALAAAVPHAHWHELSIGLFTLLVLLVWPRITKRVPGPLVALALGAAAAALLAQLVPGFHVDTIGSRFHYDIGGQTLPGIPRMLPHFAWPWQMPGPDGQPVGLSFGLVRELAGPAFAIAMLGAIESLLCAVVADGMAGTRHDPDVELVAQGIGNLVGPLFGGIAATGAIARTATLVRAGGRSPVASFLHAVFVLAAVLALAPYLAWLPMASLAALLLIVAWNMSEARHFIHIVRVAPKSDVFVLLSCFGLTVVFDMVISVSVGIVLAALMFMRRMSDSFSARVADRTPAQHADPHLQGVVVYDIGGPLFFGAAEKAISALAPVAGKARAVILHMSAVPIIDVTGLVAFESTLDKLARAGTFVVLVGVQPQPQEILKHGGLTDQPSRLAICRTQEEALEAVREHARHAG